MTPLHHVAEWSGRAGQVDVLLAHGADINAAARHGWTPVNYAVDRGREEMIAYLKQLGPQRSESAGE